MPTQTWTLKIDGPDPGPIRSFAQILDSLKGSGAQVSQSLQTVERDLAGVGRAAQQHGPSLSGFFSNALSAATGFIAANIASTIVGGLASIGQGAISAAADMERTRAGFTSITGSAQTANALIAQLQQEANRSPFELDAFRQAGQLLLGMGVAADQVVPRLRNVSNVVAAVGGGNTEFERINLALAQIQAKGKVSAEEINQLAENGVPGWNILATALGKTRADVIDLAQQGAISSEVWDQAFSRFANSSAVASAAEAQSHTFSGLLSTIHDIGQALEVSFAGPLISAVEPTLERVVSTLQDPQTAATLAEWGTAAGQFVNGLIQAGTTAVQVGGQILGALRPVTDLIGQLFGIQTNAAPSAGPNLAPALAQSAQLTTNVTATATAVKSVKDQVADLERAQRESNRTAAENELTYQHQVDRVKDKIRALQDAYEVENRSADRADLVAKIQKDELLAGDLISSQGQAAAKRLVDEKARLRQMDREDTFRANKATLENEQTTAEASLQTTRETNAKAQRDTQAKIDALRAGADTPPGVVPAPGGGPSRAVAGDSIADRYAPVQAPAQVGALTQALDGLKAKLTEFMKPLEGLRTSWGLWVDGLKAVPGLLGEIGGAFATFGTAVDTVATALGLKQGLANALNDARLATQLYFIAWEAYLPTFSTAVGGVIRSAVDGFKTLADGAALTGSIISELSKGNFDFVNAPDTKAKFAALITQVNADQQNLKQFGGSLKGSYVSGSIEYQRRAAEFAQQNSALYQGYGNVPTGNRDYTVPSYALPPQRGGSATDTLHLTGEIGVDEQGLLRVINMQINGKRLARALGDYASSGR